MVFYSIKSNEKVFHLPHCRIIRRIRKEFRKQFSTPEEARISGYRQCNCCSLVGSRLRREQKAVNQFCQENEISYHLEDGQLHVRASKSDWCIIAYGKQNSIFLYHKNTFCKDDDIFSIVPGYHPQGTKSKTIVGYLRYIVQHDDFRERERKKIKHHEAVHQALRRNTRPYQRGTTKRSFNAGQLYSILDHLDL